MSLFYVNKYFYENVGIIGRGGDLSLTWLNCVLVIPESGFVR